MEHKVKGKRHEANEDDFFQQNSKERSVVNKREENKNTDLTQFTHIKNVNNLEIQCIQQIGSYKWEELRLQGQLPERRSYHTAIAHNSRLYIYGGTDLKERDLNTCFYIDLDIHKEWKKMQLSGEGPKGICRHSAVYFNNKIYILGGDYSGQQTRSFYYIDLNTHAIVKPRENTQGIQTPRDIDSHTAIIYQKTSNITDSYMIIFGGYYKTKKTNQIFEYSLSKNQWAQIETQNDGPSSRTDHTSVYYSDSMWVFGGSDFDNNKLNDLWKLDLQLWKWEQIIKDNISEPRSGHTATIFENKMFVFGGVTGMIKEQNDLFAFDFITNQWKSICESSQINNPRNESPKDNKNNKGSKYGSPVPSPGIKLHGVKSDELGEKSQSSFNHLRKTQQFKRKRIKTRFGTAKSSPKRKYNRKNSQVENSLAQSMAVGRMNDYLNKRLGRNDILQEKKTILETPTTQALRNSVFIKASDEIDPSHQRKKNRGGIVDLVNKAQNRKLTGQPPCPRDGATMIEMNGKLVVFGGDRYQMAFNDSYIYNI